MASFPGAIATLTNPISSDALNSVTVPHDTQHANANDEIEAIETELGTLPKGAFGSVKLRLNDIDTQLAAKVATSQLGAVSGVATLDASSKLVQNLDAGKVNSGTLAVARIPDLDTAKIISGTFVDARIPNLNASKTNAGIFAVARIPDLDAAKITSGVLAAARVPATTVGINQVVADIAARDAITPKTNGMFVFVEGTKQTFEWQSTGSVWNLVGNHVEHKILTSAVTTPLSAAWGNVGGFSFAAQAGGKYKFHVEMLLECVSSSGVDLLTGWNWTGTGTMHSATHGLDVNVAAPAYNGSWIAALLRADSTSPLRETRGIGTPAGIPVIGFTTAVYECTTAGTVQFEIAQATSSGTLVVTLHPMTHMRIERMN